jgi:DNA (cytosine-5)-methyltransferase 1
MKILNLYAGIGGNRKLWGPQDITAVEIDPDIAKVYSAFYPDDKVIVGDAHGYLLNHYSEFDFIWSSPPCPTHSDIRRMGAMRGQYSAVYPDIKLWEEITLLKHFSKCKWVVENVIPYYDPIVEPSFKLDRHLFWANFHAKPKNFASREHNHEQINGGNRIIYGYNISKFKIKDKRRLLRNMVNPELGKHIFDCAMGSIINVEQLDIFSGVAGKSSQ